MKHNGNRILELWRKIDIVYYRAGMSLVNSDNCLVKSMKVKAYNSQRVSVRYYEYRYKIN